MANFVRMVTSDDKRVCVNPAVVLYVSQGDDTAVCTLHFETNVLTVKGSLYEIQRLLNEGRDLV